MMNIKNKRYIDNIEWKIYKQYFMKFTTRSNIYTEREREKQKRKRINERQNLESMRLEFFTLHNIFLPQIKNPESLNKQRNTL